jgi:hypothetical protein
MKEDEKVKKKKEMPASFQTLIQSDQQTANSRATN